MAASTMKRRRPTSQPIKCVCEPGHNAASEHAQPGRKAPAHMDRRCIHSELRHTTAPLPQPETIARLRPEDFQ